MNIQCKIILILLFSIGSIKVNGQYQEIVTSSETLEIKVGSTIDIECNGIEPLTWIPPNVPLFARKWTQITITNRTTPNMNMQHYKSVLHITNASYPWTGFYACRSCELRMNIDKQAHYPSPSWIYIYVTDDKHLSVSSTRTIFSEDILPCRPTLPKVIVEAYCLDEKNAILECPEVPKQFPTPLYDPRIGFALQNYSSRKYRCIYRYKNVTMTDDIFIGKHNKETTLMQNEEAVEKRKNHKLGSSLCILPNIETLFLNWLTPNTDTVFNQYSIKEMLRQRKFIWNRNTSAHINNLFGAYKYTEMRRCFNKNLNAFYIHELNQNDAGTYIAYADDGLNITYSTIEIRVIDPDDIFLDLHSSHDACGIDQVTNLTTTAELVFYITSKRAPNVTWINNHNYQIHNNSNNAKYNVFSNSTHAILQIFDANFADTGLFRIRATLPNEVVEKRIFLKIHMKPEITFKEHKPYYMSNVQYDLKCFVFGSPTSIIKWYFTPYICEGSHLVRTCNAELIERYIVENVDERVQGSTVPIVAKSSGTVTCKAINYVGETTSSIQFLVNAGSDLFKIRSDVEFDHSIGNSYRLEIAEGETIILYCSLPEYLNIESIRWERHGQDVLNDNRTETMRRNITYVQKLIHITNASLNDSGIYTCYANSMATKLIHQNATLIVHKHSKPEAIRDTTVIYEIKQQETFNLECPIIGWPRPEFKWFKGGKEISNGSGDTTIKRKMLNFHRLINDDSGNYKCEASNYLGMASADFVLMVQNTTDGNPNNYLWFLLLIPIIIGLILALICLKSRKTDSKDLVTSDVVYLPEATDPYSLNPDLDRIINTKLLIHNEKLTYPKKNLKFGKIISSGIYGNVRQAVAQSIVVDKTETNVLVKILDENNSNSDTLRILLSELKVLIHLESHVNIVKLLGACTEHISRKELYTIFEYCRFGNLHKFLQTNNSKFMNLINSDTGTIDLNKPMSKKLSYEEIDKSTKDEIDGTLDTMDLMKWSFQIACGMNFLRKRNVIHGYLATKNILLTDKNHVKIANFGLPKDLYQSSKYTNYVNEDYPMKWLALETLQNGEFSKDSDAWSFGVVMWELFSLGAKPYSDLPDKELLLNRLIQGHRMLCPDFSTENLYTIMTNCWKPSPKLRPSFLDICNNLNTIINSVENVTKENTSTSKFKTCMV